MALLPIGVYTVHLLYNAIHPPSPWPSMKRGAGVNSLYFSTNVGYVAAKSHPFTASRVTALQYHAIIDWIGLCLSILFDVETTSITDHRVMMKQCCSTEEF